MTRFSPENKNLSPVEWSELAVTKLQQNNDQYALFGCLGIAMCVGASASPISGLLVAGWAFQHFLGKAKKRENNIAAIVEVGCVAHTLEDLDFKRYLRQVGHDAVMAELDYAQNHGLEFSNDAFDYLESQVLADSSAKLEGTATKLTATTTEYDVIPSIDIVREMANRVSNSFILGIGGCGKGVLISNVLREIKKKHPNLRIFYIDPKSDEKEFGYIDGVADVIKRYKCETEEPKIVVSWLKKCFEDFDKYAQSNERTLLVLDEGTVLGLKSKLAKSTLLIDRLSSLTSLGDSAGKNIYFVAQTPFVGGSGIDLSASSQLVTVALVSDENRGSLNQWKRSAMFEKCDNLDIFIDNSPIKRAVYFGKTRQWYSMPKLANYSGYDRDNRVIIDSNDSTQPQDVITTIQQLETIYNKPDDTNNLSATAQTILDIIKSSSKGYSSFESIRKSRKWNDEVPSSDEIKSALQELIKADKIEPLDGGDYQIK